MGGEVAGGVETGRVRGCEVTGEDEREDVEVGDGRGVWAA